MTVLDYVTGGESVNVKFEHTISPKTLLFILLLFIAIFGVKRAISGDETIA